MIEALHGRLHDMTQRVSLPLRVALLTTAAVAAVLASVSAIMYVTVRSQLESSPDQALVKRANAVVDAGVSQQSIEGIRSVLRTVADLRISLITSGGVFTPVSQRSTGSEAVGPAEISVALGESRTSARTGEIAGRDYRIVAVPAGNGQALIVAESMDSVNRTLDKLAAAMWVTSILGIAIAGLSGWVVATNGLRPVRRLTGAAERVARTQELKPITVTGHDELARLTTAFNQMLAALGASQERQRRLVADAGHELRTPLTSLRTNIELLEQANRDPGRMLPAAQRDEMMTDVRAQLDELTTLIGDLVELARDEPSQREPELADFADIVEIAIDRVRPRAPGATFDVRLEEWPVLGESDLLERAVINLLDNAAKWSPVDGTITVRLVAGRLSVVDQGPGVAEEDLPLVFERFYRSQEARTMPGSGLGLSIVKRAVEMHGGSVEAHRRVAGDGSVLGSEFVVRLPRAEAGALEPA